MIALPWFRSSLARHRLPIWCHQCSCCISSSNEKKLPTTNHQYDNDEDDPVLTKRLWKAKRLDEEGEKQPQTWTDPVSKEMELAVLINRIAKQELDGGRMRQRQLGVLREDPSEDMRLLTANYTVPSLASAVRDREEVLQLCANLVEQGMWDEVKEILRPYQRRHVLRRRDTNPKQLHLDKPLDVRSLEVFRTALMRMPRSVTSAHQKRAGVVLCLCNVNGVPSLLLEKRAATLRAHPDEVCLPGGMVSDAGDNTIAATCLREMHEEIAGLDETVSVLGVLRCNWGDVHHLVGVAVTPLVAFVGEVGELDLRPNPDEVAEVFTLPLSLLLDRDLWIHREGLAPIFVGGPHVIWGLTGYIVERFVLDILLRYTAGTATNEPRVPPL